MTLNLMPYVNRAAYTVPDHASVLRCFGLFRTMGLRHLPVLDSSSHLRGMITRKDLLLEHVHEAKWGASSEAESEEEDDSDLA
mmetsp:Transcript_133161/g.315670  ORF Transcript_133161/g.315670 Transcript_133161/m.315670 type:complete len:83 (+) Transcript_133161:3-251(+)